MTTTWYPDPGSRHRQEGGTAVAVVLTVHGTNATGPAEGDAWWQLGSDFFRDIRRYVEGADGALGFTSFI